MLVRMTLVACIAAFGVTAVAAQGDVITERKALMKRSGDQARIGTQMVRGEAPFDPAKAQAVFATFEDKAAKLSSLFPENSRKGDTRAAAAIWDKPAEWKSAIDKFGADARAAKASVKDLESFKVGLSNVGRHCGTCHEAFRTPR